MTVHVVTDTTACLPPARAREAGVTVVPLHVTVAGRGTVQARLDRLVARGVVFRMNPTEAGPVTIAIFDDTCGNYIQLHQT